ncbi:MAG: acyl-CoA dehydrogenase family protein [Alphaproteobacteria bacterium]|nr:acyl-CoA dehydrogenase family protein [Alphaproteobacteria bacterium]MCY4320654.1 acyl-CoA dehydrogenase family protein [Alphaproteobacteria bacterium]
MTVLDRLDARLEGALPEEEAAVLEAVKRLAGRTIAPAAATLDAEGRFPWDNLAAMRALELNRMFVPEAYGGASLSFACYIRAAHELARACAATGIVWSTVFHAVKPVIDFGSEALKRRILPRIADGGLAALCITEADAGSDAIGMRTRFRPDGDEVVIDGTKTFITNGDVADIYLLFGKWTEIKDGRAAVTALVVEKETAGISVLRLEDKLGLRASSTAALAFEGVRVPRGNLLLRPGEGLQVLFGALNKSRPSIAAHALGIARAAFDDAIAYITTRRQSGRRIADFQGIQFMLADLATDLAQAELWLGHVAGLVDEGLDDIGVEASMAKLSASDLATKAADLCVQLHGGYGYIREYRAERLLRDAKITQIWEGTNQIHRQLIGRSFVRRP